MEKTIILEKENHKWYALYVTPNSERKIKSSILKHVRENNLTDYISSVEVPIEKYFTMIKGKKTLREKVMIPGYILINADLSNGEVIPTIKNVKGVFSFVSIEKNSPIKKPTPVSKKEIEKFLNVVEETETKMKYSYTLGDTIEILEGPFSGFKGEIDKKDDHSKKMIVMVDIFNRKTPVELEYHQVKNI